MKYALLILMTFVLTGSTHSCKNKKSTDHKIFLVRHAEKGNDGTKDPPLTGEGIARAEKLADMLKYENIAKVYSTDYERTRETAKPTAHRAELKVEIYDPSDQAFARKLKNELVDHSILVVGHSNTTPMLANQIVGKDSYEKYDESDFGNLIVITKAKEGLEAELKRY